MKVFKLGPKSKTDNTLSVWGGPALDEMIEVVERDCYDDLKKSIESILKSFASLNQSVTFVKIYRQVYKVGLREAKTAMVKYREGKEL